tara:strand:- start:27 stop:707 length:681 start_codon:yes stop_codon:yes gene_type:complete
MGYQIGDRKLPLDVAWTDADGIQRPANWLRLSTERDRELLGITWVAETNQIWDQKFYWGYDSDNNLIPKQLNDEAILDEDGNDTGEVQTGLKTLWKAKQNEIAASLLAPSDWRVVKVLEVNTSFSAAKTAMPEKWQTYRAAVRTACNTRQAEIDNCSDVAALKELLFGSQQIAKTKQQQATDLEGNPAVDTDGNPVMTTVNDLDDDGNIVMIANPNLATAWPDPVE